MAHSLLLYRLHWEKKEKAKAYKVQSTKQQQHFHGYSRHYPLSASELLRIIKSKTMESLHTSSTELNRITQHWLCVAACLNTHFSFRLSSGFCTIEFYAWIIHSVFFWKKKKKYIKNQRVWQNAIHNRIMASLSIRNKHGNGKFNLFYLPLLPC